MSVTNENNKVNYSATGLSVYAIPFYFSANAHVKLYVNDVLKTLNTHYSVTGAGITSGGVLTFLVTPPTSGVVTIIRDIPLKQENTFNEGGQFSSITIEGMFDKLTHISQQIDEKTDRAIKMPLSSTTIDPQISGTITPGALIQVNATNDGLETGISVLDYSGQLLAMKNAAEAAASLSVLSQIAANAAEVAAEEARDAAEISAEAAETALAGIVNIVQVELSSFVAQYGRIHIVNNATATTALPVPVANGKIIIKASSVAIPVQIVRNGTEKIDFSESDYFINDPNQALTFVSDGTDWFII